MTGIDVMEIQRIRKIVEPIASRYGVEKMYLFGSRARGENGQNSDFDFFIHAGKIRDLFQLSGLMNDLRTSLESDVDIITAGALRDDDIFAPEIKRDGVLVYEG